MGMHKLAATEYERVRPLYEAIDYHLALSSILDGTVPAEIYVDNPSNPQAALIRRKHRLYLGGAGADAEFDKGVRHLLSETIYPQARAVGMLLLYYADAGWENRISVISTRPAIKTWRQYYTFKKLKHDWRTLLPAEFKMNLVDDSLLGNTQLKNLDVLAAEMCSERESVEDFLARSFGVCLVHGDEIVGWCLSEYNRGDRCEIGIETLEPYERRGLATAMASALIEYALARGITHIGWDCFTNNKASAATALKIGFEKAVDYPVYLIEVEPG